MRWGSVLFWVLSSVAATPALGADATATRPDFIYVSTGPRDSLAISSDNARAYTNLGTRIDEFDLATRQTRAITLTGQATGFVLSYSPASNLALVGVSNIIPGRTAVALADVATNTLLPLTGAYVTSQFYGPASAGFAIPIGCCDSGGRNFQDPAGRKFPVLVQAVGASGQPSTVVALIDASVSPARLRICGAAGAGIIAFDPLANTLIVSSGGKMGTLDCSTEDFERRATTFSFLSEFANIPPLRNNVADEYAGMSVDTRIAVSKGGYVVDRVTKQILVTPQAMGANAQYDLSFRAMTNDGRYALVQRQRIPTLDQDASVYIVDTGQRRAVTFVLSKTLQPLVQFAGSRYTFSPDGSKVLFSGGGVDFIDVPVNSIYAMVVACNPFLCDALPNVARAALPVASKTVLSDDGRFAFFDSAQADLVSGDANNAADVFKLDRSSGEVTALSRDAAGALLAGGARAPSINSDGTLVAFDAPLSATPNASTDVLVKDAISGALTRLSQLLGINAAATPLFDAALSGNGKFAAFATRASGLAPGDANGRTNVFRVNLQTREVVLASGDAGADCVRPALSRDGSVVAFDCAGGSGTLGAKDAAPTRTMLFDLLQHKLELVAHGVAGATDPANAASRMLGLSADGTAVLFSSAASNLTGDDANGQSDLFLFRRGTPTQRLSVASGGGGIDAPVTGGALSGDGKAFAFSSTASNIDPLGVAGNNALYLGATDGGTIRQVRRGSEGAITASSTLAALSYTGSDVVFSNDGSSGGGADAAKAGVPNLLAANNPSVGTDALSLSSSYAGLWYNLGQNGHGFLVELAESNGVPTAIVSWYVYSGGTQRWLFGSAPLRAGGVTVPMFITRGPSFPPAYDARQLVLEPWGFLTMKFLGPDQGLFAWVSTYPGFGSGALKVDRLTRVSEARTDRAGEMPSCAGGTWYDVAQSGQGFQVEKIAGSPATLAVVWYVYDRGQQYWLIGTGPISGNRATVALVNTRNGQFPPFFNPAAIQQTPWGSLTFTFNSANSAQVAWTPTLSGFSAGSMNLTRLSTLTARPCR